MPPRVPRKRPRKGQASSSPVSSRRIPKTSGAQNGTPRKTPRSRTHGQKGRNTKCGGTKKEREQTKHVRVGVSCYYLICIFKKKKPEGPTIKKIQSRSKFSISIEIFNLTRKFQSRRLEFPHKNIGPRWVARSKFSLSLEIFNLARNLEFF